jgi:regulator of sirC expression with transglutaminase-like and TPR domain
VTTIAEHVKERASRSADSLETLAVINEVLFGDEGFRGNVSDYYDPKNSFFNDVLDRKLGIPITLSVLYMEVARRAGVPVFGVGMPGHFLLKFYEVDGRELFLDAYNSGRLLSPEDCQEKLTEIYNGQIPLDAKFLTPVGKRQILTRMLNNLRSIYMTNRLLKKALAVIDLILVIYPRSSDDVKQRAMLRYQLGFLHGAADELDEYVKMAPEDGESADNRAYELEVADGRKSKVDSIDNPGRERLGFVFSDKIPMLRALKLLMRNFVAKSELAKRTVVADERSRPLLVQYRAIVATRGRARALDDR